MPEKLPSVVVIWKITNFRIWACTLQDELDSPYFSLNGAAESLFHWYLSIDREPKKEKNKVYGIYLNRKAKDIAQSSSLPTVSLEIWFSIWKIDDSMKLIKKDENLEKKDDYYSYIFDDDTNNLGQRRFFDYNDPNFNSKISLLFSEDSIVIVCNIWKNNQIVTNISIKRLTSYIPVTEKCTFVWKIKNALDFDINCEKTVYVENEALSVTFSYVTLNGVKVIKAAMSGSTTKTSSWICCLSFPNNEVFLFESGILKPNELPYEKVCTPSVTYSDIFENQSKYLTNESLVLNCSFSILKDNLKYSSCTNETVSDPMILRKIKNELEGKTNIKTLLGDLTQLYHDKTLSDFTLEVQSKSFSIHSSLLIARSEVFSQMLQTNMKEKNERKLTVDDIDENAVSGMLEFIYTDDPGCMNVEQALKLYYAGDKYKIDGLVQKSFDFLVENLTASNVSDVLELADKHSDVELRAIVLDYIRQHEKEILLSQEFEEFSKKNSSLAAQTWLNIAKLKYSSASDSAVKTPDDERKETMCKD